MYYPLLAERTRILKETEEGLEDMSGVWDEMQAESMAQGIAQGMAKGAQQAQESSAVCLIRLGKLTLQEIAESVGLSLKAVRALAKTMA